MVLKDYIPVPDIYAAGRLDRDSEGLLLLTDDDGLIRRLTDPRHHVEKTYWGDRSIAGKNVVIIWRQGNLRVAPHPRNKEAHNHAPEPDSTKS